SRPASSHSTCSRNAGLSIDCTQDASQASRRGFRISTSRSISECSTCLCQSSAAPISIEPARKTLGVGPSGGSAAGGLTTLAIMLFQGADLLHPDQSIALALQTSSLGQIVQKAVAIRGGNHHGLEEPLTVLHVQTVEGKRWRAQWVVRWMHF